MLTFEFEETIIHWRGPAPFFFVPVPSQHSAEIRSVSKRVTYGWGVIPVEASIGDVTFTTSLFPKDEGYLLPLKDAVRRNANLTAGDRVRVSMTVRPRR